MPKTREERVAELTTKCETFIRKNAGEYGASLSVDIGLGFTWLIVCIVELEQRVEGLTDLNDERYEELLRERDRLADRIAELGEEQEDADVE